MQNNPKRKSSFKARFRIIACLLLFTLIIPQQSFAKSDKTSWSKIDLSDFWKAYKEPSEGDMWKSVGISFAACLGASYLGSLSGNSFSFGQAFSSFSTGLTTSSIAQTFTSIAADKWGFNKDSAMVFGYAISGGLTGLTSPGGGTVNFFKNGDFMNKFMTGTLQGAAMGGGNLLAYEMLKGTHFYEKNPQAAMAVTSFIGNQIGYLGFYGALDGINAATGWGITSSHRYTDYDNNGDKMQWDVTGGGRNHLSNLAAAWKNPAFRSDFIAGGIGTAIEYGANVGWFGKDLQRNNQYNQILGQSIGSLFGQGDFGTKVANAMLYGGVSVGLSALGGKYDEDGKNKWGLTRLDMAGLSYLGSTMLRGSLLGDSVFEQLGRFSVDYTSFGGTSPFYTNGAGGYSQFAYLGRLGELSGLSNFKANVDMSMAMNGYTSWNKFVGDGALATVFPDFKTTLVNYASSKLHYAAVDNFSQIISRKGLMTHEVVTKELMKSIKAKDNADLTPNVETTELPPLIFTDKKRLGKFVDTFDTVDFEEVENFEIGTETRIPDEVVKSVGNLVDLVVPPNKRKGDYYDVTNVYYPGLLERIGLIKPKAGRVAGEAIRKQFVNSNPLSLGLGLYTPLVRADKAIQAYQQEGSKETKYLKFWRVHSSLSGRLPQLIADVPVAILDQNYQPLKENKASDWVSLLQPAAEKFVRENQQEANQFVVNQLAENNVVIWGENHLSYRHDKALTEVLTQWANSGAAGNKYLFLELGRQDQWIINDFMGTGDEATLERRLKDRYWEEAMNPYELEQIKIAKNKGIKVVCMDMQRDAANWEERDAVMVQTVRETLKKDPDAQILVQVGRSHTLAQRSRPLTVGTSVIADPLQHRLQQEGVKSIAIGLEDSDEEGSYPLGNLFYGRQKFFQPLLQHENTVVPLPKTGADANIMRLFYYVRNPETVSLDAKIYFKERGETVR